MRRVRLAILLTLLAGSLVLLRYRERVQAQLYGVRTDDTSLRGRPAPELPPLATLHGPAVTLAALRGRVVLLHFFTFGCSNCEHMVPRYVEWERRFGPRGLSVVGIHAPETAYERAPARLAAYCTAHQVDWPVLLDPDFDAWDRYHVQAWPTVFVIDREGRIAGMFVGDASGQAIEREIERLVGT